MIRVLVQIVCAALFLRFLRSFFHRSSLDNIPGPKAESWWKGNFRQIFNPNAWEFHEFLAKRYGHVVRIYGAMGQKRLYTYDPKAMHTILVKDQALFDEGAPVMEARKLMFGNGLLSTDGMHHRKQRKMLSPVFSTAHMRNMLPIFYGVIHKLQGTLTKKLQDGPPVQDIDMVSWMGRTALELIGQSGFGYSFDHMVDEDSAHPYSITLKQLVPTLSRLAFARNFILPWAVNIGTPKFRRFVLGILPWKDLHALRDMVDYMFATSEEIYQEKKRALEQGDEAVMRQIGGGKDILSVLMKENMKASNEDRLDENELISQMSTLTAAAMDTTSSAMSRMLHLLASHQDVQTKLRQELIEARLANGGKDLAYDQLVALPYLDAICRETLRLYAPVPMLRRAALKDAVVPLHTPVLGCDGNEIREIHVPRGTHIIIPIQNANKNSALWGADANEWKPERWLSPMPEALLDARTPGVYSHLMTFNGGGRSCIGFKFSQLEMKAVMFILVESFTFTPSSKDSEIVWQMNGIVVPVVGKDRHPKLPVGVSIVKQNEQR